MHLAIVGAGGHGRVVADAALSGDWSEVSFFDDGRGVGDVLAPEGWRVLGPFQDLLRGRLRYEGVVVGVGSAPARFELQKALSVNGFNLCSIVHPRASVSRHVTLGAGCVVMAGAVVNTGSSVGEGVIINTNATVDHDCSLAAFSHICPGVSMAGGVSVGEHSTVGVGASVRQGLSIGSHSMIGAGAVVVADVASHTTVVGCPAKPI